jgi:hypothetical protein
MPAGFTANLNKGIVDNMCGSAAQAINVAFINIESTKAFLDTYVDADLELLGYEPNDIAVLRSAIDDLDQLRRVYEGLEDITPAKDFRTFAQRIWGTGFTGQ